MRIKIILCGLVHRLVVHRHGPLNRRGRIVDRIGLMQRDEIDRRRIVSAHGPAFVTLGRGRARKQQGDKKKSKCFHKPVKMVSLMFFPVLKELMFTGNFASYMPKKFRSSANFSIFVSRGSG